MFKYFISNINLYSKVLSFLPNYFTDNGNQETFSVSNKFKYLIF